MAKKRKTLSPADKKFARAMCEQFRESYVFSGNPVQVWKAYRLCRLTRLRMPAWVLEYFDQGASHLNQVEVDPARWKNQNREILLALGFKRKAGRGGPWNVFKNIAADRERFSPLALAKGAQKLMDDGKVTGLYMAAKHMQIDAENHPREPRRVTIPEIYKYHGKLFPKVGDKEK